MRERWNITYWPTFIRIYKFIGAGYVINFMDLSMNVYVY